MDRPIFYEIHPVSERRKRALRAAGYRIRDARFAANPDAPDNPPDPDREPAHELSRAELQARLVEVGLPARGTTEELRERYRFASEVAE